MKKIFSALMLAILACVVLSSCKKDDEPIPETNNYYPQVSFATGGDAQLTPAQKSLMQKTIDAVNVKFHNTKYYVSLETAITIYGYMANDLIANSIQEEILQTPELADATFSLTVTYVNNDPSSLHPEINIYFKDGKFEKPEYYPQVALADDSQLTPEQRSLIQTDIVQINRVTAEIKAKFPREEVEKFMSNEMVDDIADGFEGFLQSDPVTADASFTLLYYCTNGDPDVRLVNKLLRFVDGTYIPEN